MLSQGGDTSDLTESTILDLFKSDYEKKPLLSFIKNKTPAKLCSSAMDLLSSAFRMSKVGNTIVFNNITVYSLISMQK